MKKKEKSICWLGIIPEGMKDDALKEAEEMNKQEEE